MKTELLQIRLTEEDRGALDRLSHHYGVSMSGVIRMLVREADRQIVDGVVVPGLIVPKEEALATMS